MYKHYIECCIIYFSCSAAALIENSVERIHVTIVSIGTYTVLFLVEPLYNGHLWGTILWSL